MTHGPEIRGPVDQWVAKNPKKECRGAAREALLAHLKIHFPTKTPQKLNKTLTKMLGTTRGIIHPEKTNTLYDQKALGAPTADSKEEWDARNAIHNPINYPIYGPISRAAKKRKRREEAIRQLEEKGFADYILPEEEVEVLVDEILAEERPEFDGKSILELMDAAENDGLDNSMYVGYTKQMINDEAFAFLGRRGANRQKNKNGEQPLNRPMLLRGDKALPEKKRHFTAGACRKELGFKFVQVYCTDLKLNAHMIEDAMQTRLQSYPLGVRLWREVAKGQGDQHEPPKKGVAHKVFVTYSFGVHAAINEGRCRVNP
jgi:hypothetical protein